MPRKLESRDKRNFNSDITTTDRYSLSFKNSPEGLHLEGLNIFFSLSPTEIRCLAFECAMGFEIPVTKMWKEKGECQ